MDAKKLSAAVVVSVIALLAALAATAHSRRILEEEQNVFPAGVLKVGETATVDGCAVRIDGADVTDSVASDDTIGSDRRVAEPDWRFVRLEVSVENNSSRAVKLDDVLGELKVTRIDIDKPAEIQVVWLRGYDALLKEEVPPGERRSGKLAVHINGYALIFPFIVQIGDAGWGLDVIDHDAPVEDLM